MLSIGQLRRAQRNYYLFMLFNVVSISFLAGNIIFLFAIRLGAGTRLIGFLSALNSITFLFSLPGRRVAVKIGAVKTKGYFWLARYLVMLPLLLTLIPGIRDNMHLALGILTFGFFGFNIFKGLALAGEKPIQGHITRSSDLGAFISMNNIILFSGMIIMGIFMAFIMGKDTPLYMYGIFIVLGVITGFFAAGFTLKIPDPPRPADGIHTSLTQGVRAALKRPEFSRLLLLVMLSNTGIGMTLGFIVVYAKTIYGQADNMVVYFTVAGALGALSMAGILRFLSDRVGAKPVYFFFNAVRLCFLIPLIITPDIKSSWGVLLFLFLMFFLEQLTYWGFPATADVYFLSTTRPEDRMDLGIVYNITRGLFGMIGSLGGGFLLGYLQSRIDSAVIPFQIHFGISTLFFLLSIPVLISLPDIRNLPIGDAMGTILTLRGLRSIYYLNKLSRSTSYEEERGIIAAMSRQKTRLTLKELQEQLESPILFVRIDALMALEKYPPEKETIELLLQEIRFREYTTAHIAARILGEKGYAGELEAVGMLDIALSVLRDSLESDDYLLRSKAALALGAIGDNPAAASILEKLQKSQNPREIIYYVKALELLKVKESLPVIFNKLISRRDTHVDDDLIHSASVLLGLDGWFYSHYSLYLRDPEEGLKSLRGEIEASRYSEKLHRLVDLHGLRDFSSHFFALLGELSESNQPSGTGEEVERLAGIAPGEKAGKLHYLAAAWLICRSCS